MVTAAECSARGRRIAAEKPWRCGVPESPLQEHCRQNRGNAVGSAYRAVTFRACLMSAATE